MRRTALILALAALLCGSLWAAYRLPAAVSASQDGGSSDREFRVAMGKRLEVELKTGGTVNVSGWNQELVSVDAFFGKTPCPNCRFEVEETPFGLRLSTDRTGPGMSASEGMRFEIKVPAQFDLDLASEGGGFAIENVEGQIGGKTMGGSLKLKNLKGRLELLTMGGDITLTDSEVTGVVKTMGGEVLLQDVSGGVKGVSMGGNVIYRNVRGPNGQTTGEQVFIRSMGGDIRVESAPAGAEVMTMGGDIVIRSAEKFVKAKTMGGDINLNVLEGWVEATTMGGDIQVVMTGEGSAGRRDVELTSYSGDITLTVPANLSMAFDISLAYTKGHEGEFRIASDFPVEQRASDVWVEDEGSPRKYIYGTGSVAGGANRVKIQTINGNVTVKKG